MEPPIDLAARVQKIAAFHEDARASRAPSALTAAPEHAGNLFIVSSFPDTSA